MSGKVPVGFTTPGWLVVLLSSVIFILNGQGGDLICQPGGAQQWLIYLARGWDARGSRMIDNNIFYRHLTILRPGISF